MHGSNSQFNPTDYSIVKFMLWLTEWSTGGASTT